MVRPLAIDAQTGQLTIAIGFLAIVALGGGSYRFDEDKQLIVRLAALASIGAALWPLDFQPLHKGRGFLAGFALIAMLPLVQLVPLPPGLWARLPGHAIYASIATASDTVRWRPLSLTPDLTINALASLLVPAAALLATLYLDDRGRHRLASAIVVMAVASAVLGVLQLAAGGDAMRLYNPSSENAPVGLFANRNHQAALLACAMPLSGALAANAVRRGSARATVAAILAGLLSFLLAALLATGSRMGMVLGAAGLAGAGVCWRAGGQRLFPAGPHGRAAVVAGALAMLSAAGMVIWRSGGIGRLAATSFADETRVAALAPMAQTARAFLPFGAGFGSFDSVFRRFEPDTMLSTIYLNTAHNEPMQLLIEGGLPAAIAMAIFSFWWASAAWRALRPAGSARQAPLCAAMVFVSAILLASSLVDYPLRTPILAALFAISCVMLAQSDGGCSNRKPQAARPS